MVLQPTGVWKYPKNLLIIENTLSLVLASRQAKHNNLHKKWSPGYQRHLATTFGVYVRVLSITTFIKLVLHQYCSAWSESERLGDVNALAGQYLACYGAGRNIFLIDIRLECCFLRGAVEDKHHVLALIFM